MVFALWQPKDPAQRGKPLDEMAGRLNRRYYKRVYVAGISEYDIEGYQATESPKYHNQRIAVSVLSEYVITTKERTKKYPDIKVGDIICLYDKREMSIWYLARFDTDWKLEPITGQVIDEEMIRG